MFQHIDDKVHSMVATFLTFGVVAMVLGILVTVSPEWLQAISGLIFFLLAYMAFYMGYKLHAIQCIVKDKMPFVGEPKKKGKK